LQQRGIARELIAWVRSDLMPIREERPTTSLFYQRAQSPLSAAGQKAKQRLIDAVSPLIRGTTLFDAWCLADTDLAVMLQRLNLNGDGLPPALQSYAEANWQRPSVQKWVSRARKPYQTY
jgi:glutathione S-transferase